MASTTRAYGLHLSYHEASGALALWSQLKVCFINTRSRHPRDEDALSSFVRIRYVVV
jgi:hypothetical protein